ncbi:hypothetical protein K461DRAFT_298445 [Myriangium duriaei CBS 260.36]|uniref:Uncharacterized protein n=1 Tax=Myriangium duriaei CBS 260.36 TaxID=1168546 RepID=A0A9P4ISH0_9PEZI|nr:hypothetical protein K461DRAFT_298445 [Myriangium duriaei CBS 260.36]
MTTTQLPVDVLHIVANELAEQQDFSSLYRCAISGSYFAKAGAIQNLYRICNYSPVVGGGSETTSADGPVAVGEQESIVQRWAILWRSIVLSSLGQGKTLFPYCHFLRVLDLRDLLFLLDDDKFRGKIPDYFFAGDLAHLRILVNQPATRKGWRKPRLDFKQIILAVADAITRQAIKLEVLTEPVAPGLDLLSAGLIQWSPRLSNLQFLQIGDGVALGDEAVQDLLIQSCPHLTKLEIYRWMNDDKSDASLARFFRRLPANTLTSFQNESECGIGPETCLALSTHALSLTSLDLAVGNKGIPGLGGLKSCINLITLTLSDLDAPHHLEDTENDVLADMIEWFSACKNLKHLTLHNFPSAPKFLGPAFKAEKFMLDYLQISGSSTRQGVLFRLRDNAEFHLAIMRQTSLKTLLLACDTEGSASQETYLLCNAITNMRRLKKLNLARASDFFDESHIVQICQYLSDLEELVLDAYHVTDAVLPQLSNLIELKSVTFSGYTMFSFDGLNKYVERLQPGNTGLMIDIVNPIFESSMSEREQAVVRRNLKKQADGTLIYQVRDPADAYQPSDSDSD